MLGGRGSGLTRAAAEATNSFALSSVVHVGLHGPTLDHVREVMVDGPSGLGACACPPSWANREKTVLAWPNGSRARVLSCRRNARGSRFHWSWADSLDRWERLQESWDALRIASLKIVATCVPRPLSFLHGLAGRYDTAVTRGSSFDNWRNLSPSARDQLGELVGTALEDSQIHGLFGKLFENCQNRVKTDAKGFRIDSKPVKSDTPR